jgi:competence protein ComGC
VFGVSPNTSSHFSDKARILPYRRQMAFTRTELLVVIVVVVLLAAVIFPALNNAHVRAQRITCISNMKIIGISSRLWAGDNGDLYPAQQIVVSNGWKDFLTNRNAGPKLWMNFAAMGNDMGQWPGSVVCPSDERHPAESFTNHFGNTNISYFVGVGANDTYPQSIAAGDRNLGPGTTPRLDYGYSPSDGSGNDVILSTTNAVCWSLKMHSDGDAKGAGNILLGDGSSQQVSSSSLRNNWFPNGMGASNWPAGRIPTTPSIRLVFP